MAWRKLLDKPNLLIYESSRKTVAEVKKMVKSEQWLARIVPQRNSPFGQAVEEFSEKINAVKFIEDWMEKHPRG